jgi:hypothetical protein
VCTFCAGTLTTYRDIPFARELTLSRMGEMHSTGVEERQHAAIP